MASISDFNFDSKYVMSLESQNKSYEMLFYVLIK